MKLNKNKTYSKGNSLSTVDTKLTIKQFTISNWNIKYLKKAHLCEQVQT